MKALIKKQAKAVKAVKKTWVTVDDARVRHVWCCYGCEGSAEVTVPPTFYVESGTPVCGSCYDDMDYVRTEIRKE